MENWEYPFPRLEAMVADLWDLTMAAAHEGKNPPTYPRPVKVPAEKPMRRGNAAGRTPEQVIHLLKTHFGQPEAPV